MLASLARIPQPLITPRRDVWWWSRLFVALQDGHPIEIEAVMDRAALILSAAVEKTN